MLHFRKVYWSHYLQKYVLWHIMTSWLRVLFVQLLPIIYLRRVRNRSEVHVLSSEHSWHTKVWWLSGGGDHARMAFLHISPLFCANTFACNCHKSMQNLDSGSTAWKPEKLFGTSWVVCLIDSSLHSVMDPAFHMPALCKHVRFWSEVGGVMLIKMIKMPLGNLISAKDLCSPQSFIASSTFMLGTSQLVASGLLAECADESDDKDWDKLKLFFSTEAQYECGFFAATRSLIVRMSYFRGSVMKIGGRPKGHIVISRANEMSTADVHWGFTLVCFQSRDANGDTWSSQKCNKMIKMMALVL